MMINATQAKQLYDESGKEIQDFLTYHIEPVVIDAARRGNRNVRIHLDSIDTLHHLDREITPLHRGVLDALQKLGYRCDISVYGEPYVPAGLRDDDGCGPKHRNFGLNIFW